MKHFLLIFLIFLSNVLFSQNYVIELCKGDTIKKFYIDNFEYFTTMWEVTPPTSILYQDDSQIILLLNQHYKLFKP